MAKFDLAIKALINQVDYLKDYRKEHDELAGKKLDNLNLAISTCLEAIEVLRKEQRNKK